MERRLAYDEREGHPMKTSRATIAGGLAAVQSFLYYPVLDHRGHLLPHPRNDRPIGFYSVHSGP